MKKHLLYLYKAHSHRISDEGVGAGMCYEEGGEKEREKKKSSSTKAGII